MQRQGVVHHKFDVRHKLMLISIWYEPENDLHGFLGNKLESVAYCLQGIFGQLLIVTWCFEICKFGSQNFIKKKPVFL